MRDFIRNKYFECTSKGSNTIKADSVIYCLMSFIVCPGKLICVVVSWTKINTWKCPAYFIESVAFTSRKT